MTKKAYIGAIAVALLLFILPAARKSSPVIALQPTDLVSAEELSRMLVVEPATVQLVDVRSADVAAKGGIISAENVPVSMLDEGTIKGFPEHRRLILYGDRTADALDAWRNARTLRQNVYVLDGGLVAWNARLSGPTAAPNTNAQVATPAPAPLQKQIKPALRPRAAAPAAGEGC